MMKFLLRLACVLFLLAGTSAQDDGFDLSDALKPDPVPTPKKPADKPQKGDVPPTQKPKKPSSGGFDGFDLSDALGPDPVPTPKKPADKPPKGGGGSFDDFDLSDVLDNDYKPDKGRSGGRAQDPGSDPQGGADQPQAEAGSGPIAGIISAIGVAVLGAASSYFAYQKKKLCFKLQGGADPESGKGNQGTHSDPQVLSNLLQAK